MIARVKRQNLGGERSFFACWVRDSCAHVLSRDNIWGKYVEKVNGQAVLPVRGEKSCELPVFVASSQILFHKTFCQVQQATEGFRNLTAVMPILAFFFVFENSPSEIDSIIFQFLQGLILFELPFLFRGKFRLQTRTLNSNNSFLCKKILIDSVSKMKGLSSIFIVAKLFRAI